MKKIWLLIVGIIIAAGLVLSYFVFLTDIFDDSLTSEQVFDRLVYIKDSDNSLIDDIGADGETIGSITCSYTVIERYSEYKKLLKNMEYSDELNFDRAFFIKYSIVLIKDENGSFRVYDVCLADNTITVSFDKDYSLNENSVIALTVSKKTLRNTEDIKTQYIRLDIAYKPIIYLYPEEETDVTVKLGFKDKITVSYPQYVDGWSVLAKPDGKLVYNETGRNLYSLYYESINTVSFKVEKDGFVVKSEEVAEFLEEKLAILGLNEYEMEEFIIYWLPVLQANDYTYIRFATADEIERNMPLDINPNPDTVIRVLMTFKGLDSPIEVVEQELTTPEREGFVAVEWGGTPCVE